MNQTEDLRIASIDDIITPAQLHREMPVTDQAASTVVQTRAAINRILNHDDDRVLVIVGPCSIHDPESARDYASRLSRLKDELADQLLIVMRVYFEKPRTTVGWKGLINDPDLDNSFNINTGLRTARSLLLDLNQSGIPAGTEFLDLITPQYITDLVSWGAIGARTTESQVHRELASGLSCPVGFKNGTNGDLKVAIDALGAARHPHHFLSMTMDAQSAIFTTRGNEDTHIILRGGRQPNFGAESVDETGKALEHAGLTGSIMIDFSHANSHKQPLEQRSVCTNVAGQIADGESRIIGVMVESHIEEGRQDVVPGQALVYGKSITDACLGWADSEELLRELAEAVARRSR